MYDCLDMSCTPLVHCMHDTALPVRKLMHLTMVKNCLIYR